MENKVLKLILDEDRDESTRWQERVSFHAHREQSLVGWIMDNIERDETSREFPV